MLTVRNITLTNEMVTEELVLSCYDVVLWLVLIT